MDNLIKDIRFGFRRLIKSPGFSLIAIASLALGVGANTAIFSLVNTVLLRPLPVPDPSQIVSVTVRAKNDSIGAFSYPMFEDFRERNDVLSGILVYRFAYMSLSQDGPGQRVWGYEVSGNYFDVLGVKAIHGRTFLPEEGRTPLSHPVAVLSYGCWQRRFAGDPGAVGRDVTINGHSFRIIGVAPEEFLGTEIIYTPEIWVPMQMLEWVEPGSKWLDKRDTQNIFAVGRLKPGVSERRAEQALNMIAQQLGQEYPDSSEGLTISLIPTGFIIPDLRGAVVGFAWVLMGAVMLVLAVACTNLASLLLARGTDRRREIAIRLAIGASRWRLVRQLLTESVLLSVAGGMLGVMLAVWLVGLVEGFKPPVDFPLTVHLAVDSRVLVFSLAVSVATGIVFGVAPALQATKTDLAAALKDTAGQAGYRRSRLRSGLVVAQIAASLVLLVAAGLVIRALRQLETSNPGFDPANAMMMSFDVGLEGYDQARGQQFYRQALERVRALPGVRSAALTGFVPLSLNYSGNYIFVEGEPAERGANQPTSMIGSVGTDYFDTMVTPIDEGRAFGEQDSEKATQVAIINETFARQFFPRAGSLPDVIGKRISFSSASGPFVQIVGIAKDGKYFNIGEEPRSFVWVPLDQSYQSSITMVVRTEGEPGPMIDAVRGELQRLDPSLSLFDVKTMNEHMKLSLFPIRIAAAVLGGFGLLALILAATGVYGVTSYSVAQRTREMGLRMALGADPGDVLRLVMGHGVRLTAIGVAAGLIVAYALTRLMSSVLFGVSANDVTTFAGVSALLALVAIGAGFIPARRATRVEPIEALHYE